MRLKRRLKIGRWGEEEEGKRMHKLRGRRGSYGKEVDKMEKYLKRDVGAGQRRRGRGRMK